MLKGLFEAGLNVARINFSHGDSDYHRLLITRIKSLREELGMPVAILQDLQGPKIRVGKIESGTAWLGRGTTFVLTSTPTSGDANRVRVSLNNFHEEVETGSRILLADGTIELLVERIEAPDVYCRVVVEGVLSSNQGVNLPTVRMELQSLTEKDLHDLAVGAQRVWMPLP